MNTKNTNVMNKKTVGLFKDKYCDVLIRNSIMEDQYIHFCVVGYDFAEADPLLIIVKNGVHIELNGREIDEVTVNDEKDIAITLTFSDSTVILIRPLDRIEARDRYATELLMLELIRDRYKRELLEAYNN